MSVKIATEPDIEILRQVALLQDREIARLHERFIALTRKLALLEGRDPSDLQLEIEGLRELLAIETRKLYGDSSEKRPRPSVPGTEPKAPPRGHGPTVQEELPIVEAIHEIDAATTKCPKCGGELSEMAGQFEESEEITVVERSFQIVKHRRKKYRCSCNSHVETAPAPPRLQPGSRYSIDFAIEVAVMKYLDALPLERQVRIMEREGLEVTSQTLWDQIEVLARFVEPTALAIRDRILTSPVVGADETWWRSMDKETDAGKRWWVWALQMPRAVYFEISPTRGKAAASRLLAGYRGTVMADGYGAYSSLCRDGPDPPFRLVHCWSHVRRKFFELESHAPGPAGEILSLIGELYDVERDARDLAGQADGAGLFARRAELRAARSRDVVRRIQEWAMSQRALPQSGLGKAIAYMMGLWRGLVAFLDDPAIPLDNNGTERALRGPVIGRKNFYGARSRRGTEVAALFYTLVETAKLSGEEPKAWLRRTVLAALERPGAVTLPAALEG